MAWVYTLWWKLLEGSSLRGLGKRVGISQYDIQRMVGKGLVDSSSGFFTEVFFDVINM